MGYDSLIVFIMYFGVIVLYMTIYLFLSVFFFLSFYFVFVSLTLLPNCEIHDDKNCMFVSLYRTVSIKVYEIGAQ